MTIQIIAGPPGTGKTTRELQGVDDLIRQGVSPSSIAFVSYSKAACVEALQRAAAQFGLPEEDFPHFATIHATANRLREHDGRKVMRAKEWKSFGESNRYDGFTDDGRNEDDLFGSQVLVTEGDKIRRIYEISRLRMSSYAQAMLFVRDRPLFLTEDHIAAFAERLRAFKTERRLVDFIDMLEWAVQSPRVPPIEYAFVDEAQDCSPLQTLLIEKWFFRNPECRQTVVAGDDDQAIYRWNGASPEWFIEAAKKYPLEVLGQSYRIPRVVHGPAMSIVGSILQRVRKDYRPREAAGEIVRCSDPLEAIGHAGAGSLAVVARNTGLLEPYRQACLRLGEPFQGLSGGQSPADSSSKRDAFHAIARVRQGAVSIGTKDADALLSLVPSMIDGRRALRHGLKAKVQRVEAASLLVSQLRDWGASELLERLLRERPFEALPKLEEEERRYFDRLLVRYPDGQIPVNPRISLSSIHRFKGREADTIVLVPDMYGASYSEFVRGDPASEHRVAYVGITRVRERLVLMTPTRPRSHYPYADHIRNASTRAA